MLPQNLAKKTVPQVGSLLGLELSLNVKTKSMGVYEISSVLLRGC